MPNPIDKLDKDISSFLNVINGYLDNPRKYYQLPYSVEDDMVVMPGDYSIPKKSLSAEQVHYAQMLAKKEKIEQSIKIIESGVAKLEDMKVSLLEDLYYVGASLKFLADKMDQPVK